MYYPPPKPPTVYINKNKSNTKFDEEKDVEYKSNKSNKLDNYTVNYKTDNYPLNDLHSRDYQEYVNLFRNALSKLLQNDNDYIDNESNNFLISKNLARTIQRYITDNNQVDINLIQNEFSHSILETLSFITAYMSNNNLETYILSDKKFNLNNDFISSIASSFNIHITGWSEITPKLFQELKKYSINKDIELDFGKLTYKNNVLTLLHHYALDYSDKLTEVDIIEL